MDALNKALMTSTGAGANLLPYDLDPIIGEYLGKVSPMWAALPKKQADGKTHEYTIRTAVPQAWFEGELATPAPATSTYKRESVQLKILRVAGGVSGYQQAVTERFVNALQAEVEGAVQGFGEMVEWAILHGNKADAYQFDGLDALMAADATARKSIATGGNILDGAGSTIALSNLDSMIDAVNSYRIGGNDRRVFVMSNAMISKITGLQTRISRTVQTVDFEGGFRMSTYRDIPLVPSSFVSPSSTTTSPTVTATAAAGGAMADGTYHYAIASVTATGEQLMGVTDDATTATTNNSVDLTWTADANAKLYRIYRGAAATAASMTLLAVIPAKTYDSEGVVSGNVTSWSDEGALTPVAAIHPLTTGEESIYLVDLDATRGLQMFGMMSPLGERTDTFVSYIPLATRKSAFEFMIEGFMAPAAPYPVLHSVARRVKPA